MCSEKQYENKPDPRGRLPNGVEVQMLELDWPNREHAERRHPARRLCPRLRILELPSGVTTPEQTAPERK